MKRTLLAILLLAAFLVARELPTNHHLLATVCCMMIAVGAFVIALGLRAMTATGLPHAMQTGQWFAEDVPSSGVIARRDQP
jgi:hypothetical protein